MTKQNHAVIDGALFCAHRQKPIELEDCFACPYLVELELDRARPRVVCEIPVRGDDRR